MSEYKIEDNLKIPGRKTKYPFDQLKVGQGFDFTESVVGVRAAAHRYMKQNPAVVLQVGHIEGHGRCVRLADVIVRRPVIEI